MCAELAQANFSSVPGNTYDDLFVERNVIWGDFLRMGVDREERIYEEVADVAKMTALMEVRARAQLSLLTLFSVAAPFALVRSLLLVLQNRSSIRHLLTHPIVVDPS